MPSIPIRQIGLQGMQKDVSPHDVPANGLITAQNVRIKDKAIQAFSDVVAKIVVGATESLLFADGIYRDRGQSLVSGVIVVLADSAAGAFSSGFDAGYQVEGQIFVYFYDTAANRTDISPTVPFTTTEEWFGARAGEFYLLTNSTQVDLPHIFILNTDTLIALLPMPGWPANYTCRFMVPYKNLMVAGGLTKDGAGAPGLVKWSHPVSPGDVTFFWDITDPTILAGENPIIDETREMVALHPFKDLLMVYFDRAVWRITFVGGQQVLNFERAFADDGAISARSMVEVEGSSYVFGYNDVYRHDGYLKVSVSDFRLTRYFANTVDPSQRVDAVYYPINNEVIFLARSPGLPSTVDGDLLFIYNLINDGWTEGNVKLNNDGSIALLFRGPNIITGTEPTTWAEAEAAGDQWNETGSLTWAGAFLSTERDTLYALSLQFDTIYDFDAAEGENLFRQNALISHTKLDMDETGLSVGDRIFYLNRVYPQITGSGVVEFRFGVSKAANSPINWVQTCLFKIAKVDVNDPNEADEDYACDVRLAGRYLAYEMKPVAGTFFAFSGLDLEIDMVGEQ